MWSEPRETLNIILARDLIVNFLYWSFLLQYMLKMSSNVGLTTPRGSGTSGYVQRNLSHFKPRDDFAPYPKDYDSLKHRQRKPDKAILDHDRLREIEVKVFDLRDKLEDEGCVLSTHPAH